MAFYIVSTSNNQKIVQVLYGCQSEQNQREKIIILIVIVTFASNLFDMRVCSKSPQTGAIIPETVMRLLGEKRVTVPKNVPDFVMWSAVAFIPF